MAAKPSRIALVKPEGTLTKTRVIGLLKIGGFKFSRMEFEKAMGGNCF